MSGPYTEQPTMPDPDPAWLRRFEAKMKDLMDARDERAARRGEQIADPDIEDEP